MTAVPKGKEAAYRRLSKVVHQDGRLTGSFADGGSFDLPADGLVPRGHSAPAWERLDFDSFEIRVPAEPQPFEIPWSRIRALTDNEYSAHLADAAAQQAKTIGVRLK